MLPGQAATEVVFRLPLPVLQAVLDVCLSGLGPAVGRAGRAVADLGPVGGGQEVVLDTADVTAGSGLILWCR